MDDAVLLSTFPRKHCEHVSASSFCLTDEVTFCTVQPTYLSWGAGLHVSSIFIGRSGQNPGMIGLERIATFPARRSSTGWNQHINK